MRWQHGLVDCNDASGICDCGDGGVGIVGIGLDESAAGEIWDHSCREFDCLVEVVRFEVLILLIRVGLP